MWLYQVLDITATLTESLGLYLFSICFCKEPRYRASVNRWLITGISFLCAYTLTWFSELGALKAPFLLTIYLVLLLLLSEIDDIFNIQKNRYKNKGHNCYENI